MFPKMVGFPPKSSNLIGISIINHPFWGTPVFGNTHISGFPQMVGLTQQTQGGFRTKNHQNLGCEMGVPPFKETAISRL